MFWKDEYDIYLGLILKYVEVGLERRMWKFWAELEKQEETTMQM